MLKTTPTPPHTDPASPFENPNPENHHEPTDRIPSAADIRATPRKLTTMYIIDPTINTEDLLGDACESLASAHVMTLDLADRTHGSRDQTPARPAAPTSILHPHELHHVVSRDIRCDRGGRRFGGAGDSA